MTDEPLPDRERAEEDQPRRREHKGTDEQPWDKDEQPYADRPEQSGGAGLRNESVD